VRRRVTSSAKLEYRINEKIRAKKVRLVDDDGGVQGVIPIEDARKAADEKGMDLVEVAPDADPPVCRLMDFGKFKYEQNKKHRDAEKKHHIQKVKEIRLTPKTEEHDVDTKIRHSREFILHGDKVMVNMFFKGREIVHQEFGRTTMDRFIKALEDITKVEKPPKLEGHRLSLTLMPK
jgi:translation initiation factor IF-3